MQSSLVSVGIPVYNGEKYIKQALDTLISQSYKNFEVIICDNASTDNTWQICKDFEARDSRFHCYQNTENIGIFKNYQRTVDLAKGKYFMWLAHDDLCEPTLVEKQVEMLENNPDLLICASNIKIVDKDGNYLYEMKLEGLYPANEWQKARLEFFKHPSNYSFMSIYGMYVTEHIKKLGVVKPIWKNVTLGNEQVYLAQYTLIGKIQSIPEPLKITRIHKDSFSHQENRAESLSDFILRTFKSRWLLTKLVLRSQLPLAEKTELLGIINLYNLKCFFYYCPRYALGTIKKELVKNLFYRRSNERDSL